MAIDMVSLNGVNVQTSYGFYLNWRTLSAPEPQIETRIIPASNSIIDLTETFGEVFYMPRVLEIGMTHPSDDWISDYENLLANFHGQKCEILFTNDPNWYWDGRVIVSDYDSKSHRLTMTATVFPYKLKTSKTVVSKTVSNVTESNAQTVTLTGTRMTVSPTIKVTGNGSVSIKWTVNGSITTKSFSAGTYHVKSLKVGSGNVTISVWGTGTISFEYRKGTL